MDLNTRIKKARKSAKLTQAELAKTLEVGLGSIKRYEKDAFKVPVPLVSKIAHICKVDEIWLFTGNGTMRIEDEQDQALPASKLTKIIIEHQDVIKRFQDPEKAKQFTELLVQIEEWDPEGYEDLFREAKTISKTIGRLKKTRSLKNKSNIEKQVNGN